MVIEGVGKESTQYFIYTEVWSVEKKLAALVPSAQTELELRVPKQDMVDATSYFKTGRIFLSVRHDVVTTVDEPEIFDDKHSFSIRQDLDIVEVGGILRVAPDPKRPPVEIIR